LAIDGKVSLPILNLSTHSEKTLGLNENKYVNKNKEQASEVERASKCILNILFTLRKLHAG
jgi:hypothetical protein